MPPLDPGDGRVEAWAVPEPSSVVASETRGGEGGERGEGGGEEGPSSSSSNRPRRPPVVKCAPLFVGAIPRDMGVPLSLDWATCQPLGGVAQVETRLTHCSKGVWCQNSSNK